MKKIEKMIKDRPIAKKLSLIFQFILIAYLMLAAIGFVGMVQAKNYVGNLQYRIPRFVPHLVSPEVLLYRTTAIRS